MFWPQLTVLAKNSKFKKKPTPKIGNPENAEIRSGLIIQFCALYAFETALTKSFTDIGSTRKVL